MFSWLAFSSDDDNDDIDDDDEGIKLRSQLQIKIDDTDCNDEQWFNEVVYWTNQALTFRAEKGFFLKIYFDKLLKRFQVTLE